MNNSICPYFVLLLLFLMSCKVHPTRHLIIDLEMGEAKIDSQDLVIVEFTLDRIGPVRYREYLSPLEGAETLIQFEPVSKNQFNDSSLKYTDLILKAWAIDTLRNEEYHFYRGYEDWEIAKRDTALNFDGVAEPKYTHYLED